MSLVLPGALDSYGWNDRVLGLYNAAAEPFDVPGRVVRVERSHVIVVGCDDDERSLTADKPVAVGDWVVVRGDLVASVLERWSALTRTDPDGSSTQVLAANVDLVFITAPGDRFSASRVERELALAWDSGARPVVLLTKADLAVTETRADLERRLAGVDVLATSTHTGDGIAEVSALLQPCRTAVLLGPSGAGKSTLANALLGTERLAVGAVRDQDRRGRHTTTTRQLVAVPSGGVLIDTPGLRAIALATNSLDQVFPEIDAFRLHCRFADCSHEVEPGCAVRDAIERGELDVERLASFHKLQREAAVEQRRHDALARQANISLWKARAKDARRNDKRRPHRGDEP